MTLVIAFCAGFSLGFCAPLIIELLLVMIPAAFRDRAVESHEEEDGWVP